MARLLSWFSLSALVIVLAAIILPRLYTMSFAPDIAPTHMFYSVVEEDFVFREHHGHHDFDYRSASGKSFDRQGFEKTLPFIYYRNMDLWGLLPISFNGVSYDKQTIRDARQVFELKAREIADRRPRVPVHALLDSDPDRAGLSFPEDVFRMTPAAMEFVNVDVNRVDPALTASFTEALLAEGFTFPARLVAGKQTILKPFDEGVFITDATGALFHVKRQGDTPLVRRTPVPADLGIRSIKVVENEKRVFLGLVLSEDGRLFLMKTEGYGLVPLPVEGYDPDHMNYKLLINPVAPTAVYGNGEITHAVALTPDFEPFASYSRPVPGTEGMTHAMIAKALFPFTLDLAAANSGYLGWHLHPGSWLALTGNLAALAVLLGLARRLGQRLTDIAGPALLTAFTGIFGLAATLLVPLPRRLTGTR